MLKDNIFHQSAQDRLWMGLAARDAWWVKSPIGGAAISINQHTRVDAAITNTIITNTMASLNPQEEQKASSGGCGQ